MICFNFGLSATPGYFKQGSRVMCAILAFLITVSLSACGGKEKKAGQALVRVNGEEITTLQLNNELGRANVQPSQQEAATRQLLEALIDQELLLAEAMRSKVDRSPVVVQAIERAKRQIIVQSYLQGVMAKIPKPSKTEISDYYQKHPELFSQRKEFYLRLLAIDSNDLSSDLKSFMDSAKSLDEVAGWLSKNNVQYLKGKGTRNTASVPPEIAKKLQSSPKGTLFVVTEGGRSMLISLDDIKDAPVAIKEVEPLIEKFLAEKKIKEAIDAEAVHLRSQAKIEYLNASAPVAASSKAGSP